MRVVNNNAKIPYEYDRYWYTDLNDALLKSILFINAVRTGRHVRLVMHGNKNGKGITYYDITAGFDCETYTDTIQELGYMYIWQMCINGVVIKGRTYQEFIELLTRIKSQLNPKDNHRLLCFIHNAGYEFAWFRGWLNLDDPEQNFLKDKHTPLKLTHDHFIEFRDSMALVGGDSLKGLAEKYCNTQKCKKWNDDTGVYETDLDYTIPRNRFTVLTPEEEEYCDNDVLILHEFARWVFDDLMVKYKKLPMTQTGILTNKCKYLLNEMYEKNIDMWHKYNIGRSPKDEETYNVQSNFLYRGGFTHADVNIVEQIIGEGNIHGYESLMGVDITSSYPYVCTQKVFPKKFEFIGNVDESRVDDDIKKGRVSIFIATFHNIKSTGLHSIESKHKCIKLSDNAVIDNGRVYFAGEMTVYLTSFDWQNYRHFYEWEGDAKIVGYEVSEPRYLYKHIVCNMLDAYKVKAILKREGNPYGQQKVEVNTYYGFLVKKMNAERVTYSNEGFGTDDAQPYEEQVKRLITCFYDGVFVSAVARWRLLTLAYEVYNHTNPKINGIRSVYCDTDSHKFLNPTPELIDYLEEVNRKIREDNKPNIEYFTEYSDEYADLGEWDIEFYPYYMKNPNSTNDKRAFLKRFRTLGAKRYIIEVDEYNKKKGKRELTLHQTVAGLPKGTMLEQYKTIDNCFDKFSNKMEIVGCKLYSHYVDEPYTITVTDLQGHTDTHVELSCNALLPSNFKMTIDDIWRAWYIGIAEQRINDLREYRLL